MGYHTMNMPLSGNCRVCGAMLAKEVTTLHHSEPNMPMNVSTVHTVETMGYHDMVVAPNFNETKSVTDVWCTGCGIRYNSQ